MNAFKLISNKYGVFATFIFSYCLIYASALLILPDFRYLKYVITILFFIYLAIVNRNSGFGNGLYFNRSKAFFAFLFISFLSFLLNIFSSDFSISQFYKDLIFITVPFLVYFFLPRMVIVNDNKNYTFEIVLFTFYIFAVLTFLTILKGLSSGSFNLLDFVVNSVSPFETTLAFPLGMFVIFFAYKKKKYPFIFSLLLTILASKRIVILSLILVYFVYFFINRISRVDKFFVFFFAVAINLSILFFVVQFSLGSFDSIIENYLGLSSDFLSMGRRSIYENLFANDKTEGLKFFIGNGLGSSYVETVKFMEAEENLHSDILKLFYDTGFIGLVTWIVFIYGVGKMNKLSLLLAVYLNLLYLTDNVFIYYDTMIVFYILIFVIIFNEYLIRKNRLKVNN